MRALGLTLLMMACGSALAAENDWRAVHQLRAQQMQAEFKKAERAGAMNARQLEIDRQLAVAIPMCALLRTMHWEWKGEEDGVAAFRQEERRCFIRVFSEQLDKEDWKSAEKVNTAAKKFAPYLALPGVDDRD